MTIDLMFLACLLAILTCSNAAAGNTCSLDASSSINILHPESLKKANGYEHRESLFGVHPYIETIRQNLQYYSGDNSELCNGPLPDNLRPTSSYILMMDRGGCTFVTKVRHAQQSGAVAAIFADNTCMCSDVECLDANPDSLVPCETQESIMADDGSGADIRIPSFLMFKRDADAAKAVLMENGTVEMEISWSIPVLDPVEYQIWTIPNDYTVAISNNFWAGFQPLAIALGDRVRFTPRYLIYNGVTSGCRENQCYNLCTNGGLYCSIDPDGNLERGISGADLVEESLRRMCIWEIYGAEDGVGLEWWNYVSEFASRCSMLESLSNETCINGLYNYSNVNGTAVDLCMRDSGGLEIPGGVNTLLDNAIASQQECNIVTLPTLVINGAVYSLDSNITTPSHVFRALCTTFDRISIYPPDVCSSCADATDPVSCVEEEANSPQPLLPEDMMEDNQDNETSGANLTLAGETPSNANLTTADSAGACPSFVMLPTVLSSMLLLLWIYL